MRKRDLIELFKASRSGFWSRVWWAVRFVARERVFDAPDP